MDPQTAQALRQIQTALAPALRRTLHLRRAQHVQEPAQRRLPHSAGSRTAQVPRDPSRGTPPEGALPSIHTLLNQSCYGLFLRRAEGTRAVLVGLPH
jgi:hypothetical protein